MVTTSGIEKMSLFQLLTGAFSITSKKTLNLDNFLVFAQNSNTKHSFDSYINIDFIKMVTNFFML